MSKQRGPLEEIGGDWFVNRNEELDLFWRWATNIPERVHGSYALIGLRRTGKTAILHRLFNRLFNEQEKVIPIYISFARYLKRPEPITSYEFAREYFTGFVRSYLAFHYRAAELLEARKDYEQLFAFAQQKAEELVLAWFQDYQLIFNSKQQETRSHSLMQWVINFPKGYAWVHSVPMVIIIDEFQVLTRVYNPDSQMMRNLTDSFQEASETHWAPLLVSGSSVSMMVENALGGLLSGRFRARHLKPLTQEFAYDMIFRLGQERKIEISEDVVVAIWALTQGYPYPIECLLNSDCPALTRSYTLAVLQDVLAYELTQTGGALWSHYKEEYGKYIHEINGDQTTRKILLWIVKYPERRIFADEIAAELQLEEHKVRLSLEKLHDADIITSTGWYSYEGPADPMLRRYIEYSHAREVEKLGPEEAMHNLLADYRKLQGETSRKIGHLAEIIVGGVMRSFDGRTVDGMAYFSTPTPIMLPKFSSLERRGGVIKDGSPKEIDIIAEWRTPMTPTAPGQTGVWLVSVRHRNRAMGDGEVRQFLEQTTTWLADKAFDRVIRWYVSKSGFTRAAADLLQAEGVYYSDLTQFNQLAPLFGFFPLTV